MSLCQLNARVMPWREQRGYFMVDSIRSENGLALVSGFVKNSFAVNELIHITGLGDFAPKGFSMEVLGSDETFMIQPNN